MLTRALLNPNALKAQYAVRGPIVERAQQLEAAGRSIIYCNIGNPQALQQKPITYVRQLLSLVEYPALLHDPAVMQHVPADVAARARTILDRQPSGTGAYSQSCGIPFIREAVAAFIAARDGIPASPGRVILTDGASRAIDMVIGALLRDASVGIMIPVPQYPLYSATIALRGGQAVEYFCEEERHWELTEAALESALARARQGGVTPAAIVVINPGNPTGAVLSYATIAMVVQFARRNGLMIMADEVYQENVYAEGRRFVSFAKVLHDLGDETVSLASFHSVSKGFLGECGHRGGYVEFRNVPDDVMAEFAKLQSIGLCANVPGQLATYAMVAPPVPGDPSHATYAAERDAILVSLKKKAGLLAEAINTIPGMSLERPQGAMYSFVRLELPAESDADLARFTPAERAAHLAERDVDYCLALLEETGICVVPGSGFGQAPGTLHFRTTFLPPLEEIEALVDRLRAFHERYIGRLAATPA